MPSEILKPVPLLHQSEFSTPPALEKQSLSFHTQDSGEPFTSVLSGIQLLIIGVLLLVLAVKVAARIRERRFNRHVTENIDANVGTKARIPPLGSMAMASMAKNHADTVYWQHLLAAYSEALESEGYTLSDEPRSKAKLSYAALQRVGVQILRARSRYLSPNKEMSERDVCFAQEDGYADSWATWCQKGAEAAGWYVVRRQVCAEGTLAAHPYDMPPDGVPAQWFRHAWPLQQIILMWSGPKGSLRTELIDGLRRTACRLHTGDYTTGSADEDELQWQLIARTSHYGPSFFGSVNNQPVEDRVWHREFHAFTPDVKRDRIDVLLQGIHATTPSEFSRYLELVAEHIEQGGRQSSSEDDDSGWAYRVYEGRSVAV
jgi:hypothetical protein